MFSVTPSNKVSPLSTLGSACFDDYETLFKNCIYEMLKYNICSFKLNGGYPCSGFHVINSDSNKTFANVLNGVFPKA